MHPPDAPASEDLESIRVAILVVDLVESVRLMQMHETQVIRVWRQFVAATEQQLAATAGSRVVKHLGDGLLMRFATAPDALAAAFECQRTLARLSAHLAPEAAMRLRMGLHIGPVLEDHHDLLGHAVNVAARLPTLGLPGQVVLSSDAHDELIDGLHASFEDLGDCWLKHVDEPVRAYRARALATPLNDIQVAASPVPPRDGASLAPRLAVLDFDGPQEGAALGSLLADELAALLTAQPSLELISRLSTRHRGPPRMDSRQVLRGVRATFGLGGSCSAANGRVVLHLELIACGPDTVLWSGRAQAPAADLINEPATWLQPLATEALAALQAHEARRARTLPIASLESYALLMGGVTLMHRLSRSQFERSGELLEAVAERAARHPDCHAWLARWHLMRAFQGWSDNPQVSSSRADQSARRALDLDEGCSLALTVAGMVQTYGHRRLDDGERLYRLALEANPNDALAWLLKGALHGFKGEGAQALSDARRALALSPLDPQKYYYDSLAASAAVSAGDYDEAVVLGERSLRANCQHASTLRVLALAETLRDNLPAARAHVERMLTLEPGFTVTRFLQRAPGAEYPIGRLFADVLRRAGVPD